MATSSDVAALYSTVIRTVIQGVRKDFLDMGVDEQAIFDLQAIWEQKLLASRVFNAADYPMSMQQRDYPPSGGFSYQREGMDFSQHGLNAYNNLPGSYPAQPVRLPPPGYPVGYPQMPPQPPPHNPYQGPPRPPGNNNNNGNSGPSNHIPQYDGADDDAVKEESGSVTPTLKATTPSADTKAAAVDADELGSDLDDEDEANEEDEEIDDLILCLYEKVNRTRNKWKCNFKSGIANINGQDFAFSKLNGDFEW